MAGKTRRRNQGPSFDVYFGLAMVLLGVACFAIALGFI